MRKFPWLKNTSLMKRLKGQRGQKGKADETHIRTQRIPIDVSANQEKEECILNEKDTELCIF